MITLLLLILTGFGMAYFATQNTALVSLNLANFPFVDLPLYVVVLGSMLFGILLSWLINMVNGASTLFTIMGKDSDIAKANRTIEKLKHDNHDLELEVTRLKGEASAEDEIDRIQETYVRPRPTFLGRLKHGLGYS